jgi:serine/threonine-protein kinase
VLIARRYRLERALGQGGMGIVWAAVHTVTQKRVALKFLKGPVGLRPELRRRFLREARAASAVLHPNVLEVHDVFELDDDTPVMLMDLLEGETLGQRLGRQGKMSVAEAADIMVQVVSAVGTAHAVGVVHRDLKPENVFLVRSSGAPSVRVLDFGIAKLVGAEGATAETAVITGTGSMLGTPCYMSPEQSFGDKYIDYRTDIWSLGCILYECLTGVRTLEGEGLGQIVRRLLSEGIRPIATLVPDLPRELTELVGQMLTLERDQRPRDLRDVQEVLKGFATTSAPDFGAPVSEPMTMPSGAPPAPPSAPADSADVTRASNPNTGDATVCDTVKSAEPAPVQVPSAVRSQPPSWRRTTWIAGALLLAVGLPILATHSASVGPQVPSAAVPRTSAKVPSQSVTAATQVSEQRPSGVVPSASASATPMHDDTVASRQPASPNKPRQDVRPMKPSQHSVESPAVSATPPAPSASAVAPSPRPHVGGLAEKPPF